MNATVMDNQQLTAADRCDRRGAQAYLRVTLARAAVLCAHHARKHSDKLKQVALHLHDETGPSQLNPNFTGAARLLASRAAFHYTDRSAAKELQQR